MTYWKTQHFKAMQAAWYAKLASDGFEDAEVVVGCDLLLRQAAEHPYRDKDEVQIATREDYYRILAQKLEQERSFRNDVDRMILALFVLGTKIQRIVEILEREGKRRCRMTIRMTIRKYEMAWGIRKYSFRQLNRPKELTRKPYRRSA